MRTIFRRKKDAEHRYYLLPGMGRSNRRRHRQIFRWAVVVGIIISFMVAGLLVFLNQL